MFNIVIAGQVTTLPTGQLLYVLFQTIIYLCAKFYPDPVNE